MPEAMQANLVGYTTRFPPGKEVLGLATNHNIFIIKLNRAAVTHKVSAGGHAWSKHKVTNFCL
jgi:hypothetical protein